MGNLQKIDWSLSSEKKFCKEKIDQAKLAFECSESDIQISIWTDVHYENESGLIETMHKKFSMIGEIMDWLNAYSDAPYLNDYQREAMQNQLSAWKAIDKAVMVKFEEHLKKPPYPIDWQGDML